MMSDRPRLYCHFREVFLSFLDAFSVPFRVVGNFCCELEIRFGVNFVFRRKLGVRCCPVLVTREKAQVSELFSPDGNSFRLKSGPCSSGGILWKNVLKTHFVRVWIS